MFVAQRTHLKTKGHEVIGVAESEELLHWYLKRYYIKNEDTLKVLFESGSVISSNDICHNETDFLYEVGFYPLVNDKFKEHILQ